MNKYSNRKYKSKISTLEVTVSQQAIEIKKLQETVAGDLTTCSIEAWEIVDEQIEQIKKLQQLVEELEGLGYKDIGELLMEADIDLGEEEMTKKEQIEELVEWIVESMDMDSLENYVRQQLSEYYNSPDGEDDFNINYEDMRDIKGDD